MSSSSVGASLNSQIDEKLRSISGLNANEAPPISQKRLVAFVNHFVISTVEFLDSFSQSCFVKLSECDRKINKIDTVLKLLEAKLNSIPFVQDDTDIQVDLPKPEPSNVSQLKDDQNQSQPASEGKPESIDGGVESSAVPDVDPRVTKYLKMLQFGVPLDGVKNKMRLEGVDPNLLKL